MKLNLDCVRKILFYIEKGADYNTDGGFPIHNEIRFGELVEDEYFKKYSKSEVLYALEILLREHFIECSDGPTFYAGNIKNATIIGLSYSGHDLLDNIRNDTVWTVVKEKALTAGGFSLKSLATTAGSLSVALMTNSNALSTFKSGIEYLRSLFY